ncbi:hypothetical protein D3C81_1601760 [compost metagenome]
MPAAVVVGRTAVHPPSDIELAAGKRRIEIVLAFIGDTDFDVLAQVHPVRVHVEVNVLAGATLNVHPALDIDALRRLPPEDRAGGQ